MRCRRLVVLLFSFVVVLTATLPSARAQTSNSEKQSALREEIAELTNEEVAAQQVLDGIRARKSVIDARVAELDAQVSSATARLTAAEAEVTRLQGELDAAQARLDATQAKLDAAKDEVRKSAAQMYRSARRGATFDYLTLAEPDDLVHAEKYLDRVNGKQRTVMQRIATLRDEVAQERARVAATKQQADAAAQDAQRARDDIAKVRAEIEPARAEAAAQADAESAQIAELARRRRAAEQDLAAVSEAIAAELRAAAASGAPLPAMGSPGGCDARPVNGSYSSGFGPRWGSMHTGVDLAAPSGTPIYACWPGRVVIAGWQGGYGNAVVIDHGGGRSTLYGHQSSIAVSVGQVVSAGQVIGYVGSTGNSTGPHLHFEVRINGSPIDPSPFL